MGFITFPLSSLFTKSQTLSLLSFKLMAYLFFLILS